MRLRMSQIAGAQTALGDAVEVRRHLATLMAAVSPNPNEPEPLFADFTGIEFATASYLRETLVILHRMLRARRSNFYLVIANAAGSVLDDLAVLTDTGGLAFLSCNLDQSGKVSDIAVIGRLDPKRQTTFDEVRRRGETDARELLRASAGHEEIGPTAFNNRLAALVNLGLIAETAKGKSKRYRPVLTEVGHGN